MKNGTIGYNLSDVHNKFACFPYLETIQPKQDKYRYYCLQQPGHNICGNRFSGLFLGTTKQHHFASKLQLVACDISTLSDALTR